jgi:hypothetical protein
LEEPPAIRFVSPETTAGALPGAKVAMVPSIVVLHNYEVRHLLGCSDEVEIQERGQ